MSGPLAATTETGSVIRRPSGVPSSLWLVWSFPRAGTSVLLSGEREVVFGREASCEVVLDGAEVSRRHVAISREDSRLVARDLESRNGLWINGRRVTWAALAEQDVVRIGGHVGVVSSEAEPFREIFAGLWGGALMQSTLAPLERAAPSALPIVLEGETGTGKEVIARGIHARSGRRGPFLAINCGALPESLAESELFGHRRGAFTGAEKAAPGVFRSAEGGTLLLDEISELPLGVQTKLLRVLEEGAVQPLGEARAQPVDVRIIAAGQQSLRRAVAEGRFRADLLARLDGLTLRLPPLRDRREDVVPLFGRLLADALPTAPELDAGLAEALSLHDWPFNVRELVFLVRRLVTLQGHLPRWDVALLPEGMAGAPRVVAAGAVAAAAGVSVAEPAGLPGAVSLSLAAVLAALRTAGGNVARAASLLGVSRQRLYRFMEASEVDLASLRGEASDERDRP